jgi:putative heme iron utilization protein
VAVLSTHSLRRPGYPFGSLTTYCLDRSGLPVLLLSHLAQHTRNLAGDPRCSLLLARPGAGDPQEQARLSVPGDVRPLDPGDGDAAERYFRYFPHARPYFEALNFRFFRLLPRAFHLNAGFAAARWLGKEAVVRTNPFGRQQEKDLIAALEARPERLARLPGDSGPQPDPREARVVGVDAEGIDLRRGHQLARVGLPRPAVSPESVLAMLDGD